MTQVLGLPKLEILDISKNNIDGIPEDIKRMTNLKFLAVPFHELYENASTYGPQLAALPHYLAKYVDPLNDYLL